MTRPSAKTIEEGKRHLPHADAEADSSTRRLSGQLAGIDVAADSGFQLVELTPRRGCPDHADFGRIKALLRDSVVEAGNVQVWSVENRALRDEFEAQAARLGNVQELWHSTNICTDDGEKCLDPNEIFDTGFSTEESGNYGRGAYFAKHALYCTGLMKPPTAVTIDGTDMRADGFLILAEVALGQCHDCGVEVTEATRDLPKGLPDRCDSWTGTEGNFKQQFVSYENKEKEPSEVYQYLQREMKRASGDSDELRRLKLLWRDGQKYGEQYIIPRADQAYPKFLVAYTLG